MTKWTEDRLQTYITDKIEESLHLDYKAAGALDRSKKIEITKDVSAMANSDGGVIIYGIAERRENKALPGTLTPINQREFSKEWLEQIIQNIEPRIIGIEIHPVNAEDGSGGVYYVVEVPKASTAHQALDQKYYRRFNFESVAMYDHEIRDLMNRQTTPRVEVEVFLWLGKLRLENHIFCKMRNVTNVFAEHAALKLRVPVYIENRYVSFPEGKLRRGDDNLSGWLLLSLA